MKARAWLCLLAAGCGLAVAADEQPLAAGSLLAIGNASRVARRCGVRDTRLDLIDRRRAVLMMGTAHDAQSEDCLRTWIATHPRGMDPALLAQVQRS